CSADVRKHFGLKIVSPRQHLEQFEHNFDCGTPLRIWKLFVSDRNDFLRKQDSVQWDESHQQFTHAVFIQTFLFVKEAQYRRDGLKSLKIYWRKGSIGRFLFRLYTHESSDFFLRLTTLDILEELDIQNGITLDVDSNELDTGREMLSNQTLRSVLRYGSLISDASPGLLSTVLPNDIGVY
ncbi:hypothetical protein Ocin01_19542, partial [Orchesella cincta]